MPTLENINGASLVASPTSLSQGFSSGFNVGDAYRRRGIEDEQREAQAQRETRRQSLTPEALKGGQEAMNTLIGLDPQYANMLAGVIQSRDEQASNKLIGLNDRIGATSAAALSAEPNVQRQMYLVEAQKFTEEGNEAAAQEALQMAQWSVTDPERFVAEANKDLAMSSNSKVLMDMAGIGKGAELKADQVQSSKILPSGVVIKTMKSGPVVVEDAQGNIVTGQKRADIVREAEQRGIDIQAGRAGGRTTAAGEASLPIQEKRETLKANTQRITALSQAAKSRKSAAKKAQTFLDALKSGDAFSGAGRKTAQFIPGVYTSQGQFDERFNAFSEVAAREQLKAAGEIRPTDADVQGMKAAMFGVGRDETVNVQLLQDFINDLSNQDEELNQLRVAKKSGTLDSFTGVDIPTPKAQADPIAQGLPSGMTDNGDGTFTLPDGRIVRRTGG